MVGAREEAAAAGDAAPAARPDRLAAVGGRHVFGPELDRVAERVVELQHVGGEGLRIDERVERERRLAALPACSHNSSRSFSLLPSAPMARTCVASLGTFEVSAWWREITTSGVHLPGVMPSILNSMRQRRRRAHRFVHVGVHAAHVGLDDLLAARMVVIQFGVEVAAELVEARADVAVELARAEDLGHGAGGAAAPDFELEEPVLRGQVALRHEEVVFVLRVDVIEAPAVADHFHRLLQSAHGERVALTLGLNRVRALGRAAAGHDEQGDE